jgi:hypothetical protein
VQEEQIKELTRKENEEGKAKNVKYMKRQSECVFTLIHIIYALYQILLYAFVQLAGDGERFVMIVTCCCKCRPYRVSCVGSSVVESAIQKFMSKNV